jgi:hypothetical protein
MPKHTHQQFPIIVEIYESSNGSGVDLQKLMLRALIDYNNVKHRRKFAGLARDSLFAGYTVLTKPHKFQPTPDNPRQYSYGTLMSRADCKVYFVV